MTAVTFDPAEEERLHDLAVGARADDGAELLDDVRRFVASYVAFPSTAALNAATLWAAHTHVLDAFESSPRLALLSPEPGSGKTRVLEVLGTLVPGPMHALSASAAAIFRSIEKQRPVLLFDEVDALFSRHGKDDAAEDLRALLNAGHRRGASIPRCTGPHHDVALFPVFAAAALAGLGDLPDTLMSRSVIVRMRRRRPDEEVRPFRYREAEPFGRNLRDRLALWAAPLLDELRAAWPAMPEGVTDRPADLWEPMLALADAAGGHWPVTARDACVALCKVAESRDASLGVKLLGDLRDIFEHVEVLATEVLLGKLHDLEESPWGDLRGRALDARGLARRLGAYGIGSTKVKTEGRSLRGYRREDLWDAWQRYLPAPTSAEAEPPEPPEPRTSEAVTPVPLNSQVPEPGTRVEPRTPTVTSTVPEVPLVPDMRTAGRRDNGDKGDVHERARHAAAEAYDE